MGKKKKMAWLPLIAVAAAYGAIWNPIYVQYILYDAMLEAMQISNMQLSALISARVLVGVITGIPGGWIADKFDTKKVLVVCLLSMIPFVILEVLTTDIYILQVISFCGMCACTALGFWPAVLKAIRLIGGKEHQSTTFGFFEAIQGLVASLGNALALVVFAWFTNEVFGYKMAMVSMAVYIFICGILVLVLFKEEDYVDEEVIEKRKKFSIKQTLEVLKLPEVYLVAVLIFAVMGFYNNQTYTNPYFTGVLGMAVTFTGFVAIIRDYGAKVVGGPVGGWIAQKLGSPTLLNSLCLLISGALFFMVPRVNGGVAFAIGIIILAAFVGCFAKSTMWATMDEAGIPIHLTGTAVAMISLVGSSLPNFLFPLINGYLLDKYANDLQTGYNYYFTIIVVVCVIGAACGFILLARKKKRCANQEKE